MNFKLPSRTIVSIILLFHILCHFSIIVTIFFTSFGESLDQLVQFILLLNIANLFTGIMALIGCAKNEKHLILPHMIANMVQIIVNAMMLIMLPTYINGKVKKTLYTSNELINIVVFGEIIIMILLFVFVYFWSIIYRFYGEISKKQEDMKEAEKCLDSV